jgi:hypothetical protein
VNCQQFATWLDEGMEPGTEAPAHAVTCAHCAALLRAAEEVEAAFLELSPPAPEEFGERVMARVTAIEAARSDPAWLRDQDAFPWWARAAAQPAVVVAFALAALLTWWSDAVLDAGVRFHAWVVAAAADASLPSVLSSIAERQSVVLALGLALLPAAAWFSLAMFRWSSRAVAHAASPALDPRLTRR